MKKIFRFSPPLLYKLCIGIMLLSLILPIQRSITFPHNLGGIILLVIGVHIALVAKRLFKKTNTPMSPEAEPIRLHTQGVFKYSRNPMYLGIVIGLIGIAIGTGYLVNLIFPFIYLMIMNYVFIKHEEENLEKEFGNKYKEYRKKTRRWI